MPTPEKKEQPDWIEVVDSALFDGRDPFSVLGARTFANSLVSKENSLFGDVDFSDAADSLFDDN